MPRAREDWTGIYPHYSVKGGPQNGFRVVVSGGSRRVRPIKKWFHGSTPLTDMQAWRKQTQARLLLEPQHARRGTFAADVDRYLKHPNVTRLLDFPAREFEITRWLPFFGARPSADITADHIRRVMEAMATEPRRLANGKVGRTPLSRARIDKFLTALKHLGRVLFGKHAPWAAADVEMFDRGQPDMRSLSETERIALRAALLTVVGSDTAPKMRQYIARLRVLFETGMPSGYLRILSPADIDLAAQVIYRPRRRKGAGSDASPLALSLDAVDAVTELLACDALGDFHAHTLSRILNRVATSAGITRRIRPHDLRHTILDELVGVTGDEGAVAHFAQHANVQTTRRIYTRRSIPPRVRAAVDALNESRGRKLGDTIGDNHDRKSANLDEQQRIQSHRPK